MTIILEPIRTKKISEEIVSQIKQLISKGELKPGDRIPSERELAAMLGVSRPSVREAIMVLEAMGFLESRQGGGTFVKALTAVSIMDPLAKLVEKRDPELLRSLAEVRMGLESWSAYLAGKRATAKDIAELRRLYYVMEKQAAKGGWDSEIDAEFHYAITAASTQQPADACARFNSFALSYNHSGCLDGVLPARRSCPVVADPASRDHGSNCRPPA